MEKRVKLPGSFMVNGEREMLVQRNSELEPNFRSLQSLSACIFPFPLIQEGL